MYHSSMKNMILRYILTSAFTLVFYFFSPQTFAQEGQVASVWRVETKDGNVFYGRIISQDQEILRLDTESIGEIEIPLSQIRSITEGRTPPTILSSGLSYNLQSGRYFYAPNGYGLKKGEGYYQNVWIFFNQVSYGFSDYFTMGLGTVPLFLFGGLPTPVWLTPKVNLPLESEKVNLGLGGIVGTVIGESTSFGLAYGTLTLGSRDQNLSIGMGYGMADGEWTSSPLINMGGMYRLGEKGYLLMEGYYLGIDDLNIGFLSLGGRTVWENISLDYGGVIPIGEIGEFFIIPWLGLTVPLKN